MAHRIAVIFEYPSLNGGENSMLQAMRVVDPNAFDFVAIAPGHGMLADALRERSIHHVPFDWHDPAGKRLPRQVLQNRMVEVLQRVLPDLVHANSLSMGRLTGSIQGQLSVPCTTHVRDIIKLSRAAVNDVNANRCILAVSQATREFHAQQGMDSSRIRVVYNGVDCDRFKPRLATGFLRRELNLSANSFITLTIGQIGLRKAQDVLAAAAPKIAANVEDVHFVVVGERNSTKAESVDFEHNLAAQFREAGLADRYHPIGYREDVDRLLNEADLLVHTAKQEPLGRVLLEAGAAGLAIIATDVGGTRELLTDGVSARIIPPGDPLRLADAIIELAGNPMLRQQFAVAARQTMVREFDATYAGKQLADVWHGIIDDAKRHG